MSPTAKIKKRQDMSEPSTFEESSILPKTKGNKIIIHRGITAMDGQLVPTKTLWYSQVQGIV